VFADTSYWLALVVKHDEHHERARECARKIRGRIVTTTAVLLETANALSRPAWRHAAEALLNRVDASPDIVVVPESAELWRRGRELFSARSDKAWSLTDCISFEAMRELGLTDALTADRQFQQAGFRALVIDPA
jgi:predicted nucleic acid-binding protein